MRVTDSFRPMAVPPAVAAARTAGGPARSTTNVTIEERSQLLGQQTRSIRTAADNSPVYGERAQLVRPQRTSGYSLFA